MGALHETQARQRLLPVAVKMRRGAQRQLLADAKFMDDTVGAILAERKASGDPGTDLLGHMLVGTDKQGNRLPDHNIVAQCETFLVAGHETTSGLLSFVIAYLLKNREVVARAQEEVDRVLGHRPVGAAHGRPGPAARLHPADPRRDAAPVADGARVHPPGPRADHGRRMGPVRTRAVDHRADPDAAPADGHLGRGRRGVQPGPLRAAAPRRPAAQRVQAVRVGAAGVHRAPVRAAGGDAGARHAPPAVRVRRPRELPAQDQGVADHQARGADDHRPPPLGTHLGRDAAAGRHRRHAADPGARRRAGRPARHPAAGALRLEPRRRRRTSPRGSRARRRTGATPPAPPGSTTRSGSCRPKAPSWSSRPPTTGSRRTTPAKFCTWVDDRRDVAGRGALHRLRLRQPRLGGDLPGGADPGRRRAGGARRDPGVPAGRGRRPRRLRRPVRGLVRRAVGRPGLGSRAGRRCDGDGRERPAAVRRRSSSAARRARSCSPTAARRRPCGSTGSSPRARAPRAAARCVTSRSRCRPASPTPRATTSGCCRATTYR